MRYSTLWLALTAAAIGCSGSDDSAQTNEWRPTDGGTGGSTDGAAGSAGADAADASDGNACTPKTCTQLSAVCGTAPDQCGGVVSCGSCPDGQTCGGSGANKCGTATCSSKTCAQLGASCGWVSDQCGSALDCGSCPTGQTCGGAGVPNQCSGQTGSGGSAGAAGAAGSAGSSGSSGSSGSAGSAGASGSAGSSGAAGSGGSAPNCTAVCSGHCGTLQGCACGGCGANETCSGNVCVTDCGAVCSGHCGTLQGCACGGCGANETCSGNVCVSDCGAICSGHCGTISGCSCGGCSGSLVCNGGVCAECYDGDTDSESCDPGMYCPPGTRTRTCYDGAWGSWSKCAAGTTWKTYYGDGGTHCGTVVCIQVSPTGSNDNLAITISKANSGTFDNDTDITLQPWGSTPQWNYCLPTQGKTSYTLYVDPADYGISQGSTISINAWVWSPCNSSVGYQTEDAYISRCK